MTLVLDIHSIIKVYISVIAFPFDSILIEQGKNQKKGKIVIKIKEKWIQLHYARSAVFRLELAFR